MPGVKSAARAAAVVAVAFGFALSVEESGSPLATGEPAPGLRLPSLSGSAVDLADYRGHVVVLNFWATWCPPCVEEMPSLERLHRALGPEGLAVVAVAVDEDQAVLRAFAAGHSLTLPVLLDPGGRIAARSYRVEAYPQTFILDRQGRLLRRYDGPAQWDTPEALAHFRSLLAPLGAASPTHQVEEAGESRQLCPRSRRETPGRDSLAVCWATGIGFHQPT